MTTLEVVFAGSRYGSVKVAPDGVAETLELWLKTAGISGRAEFRAVDRVKGTGTMACVQVTGIRDGTFLNARIRPQGLGNESAWAVSIPAEPLGVTADVLFDRLKKAAPKVNGDEDKFLAAKLRRLFTYLNGASIDLGNLDPAILAQSHFETLEDLENGLESANLRRKFVRKTDGGRFEWRKGMKRVTSPPLEKAECESTKLDETSGEHEIPAKTSTENPPILRPPSTPTIDRMREELDALKRTRDITEDRELDIGNKRASLKREESEAEQALARTQSELERIRSELSALEIERHNINEKVHRTNAKISELEENIASLERENADKLAEQLVSLAKEEADELGLSNEALMDAIRRRLI